MMGQQNSQKDLFAYHIDLDRRVRPDNPLRQVVRAVDFSFVRQEVAHTYGHNGQVSVDPVVIVKMMFLLFFDNVSSERQLMRVIPERLDYLWFLGYGLDEDIPNHSVLSKARARWGADVFEKLFVRTVAACVHAGLVDGSKIHIDGSLIKAHASTDAVVEGPPELITALRAAYRKEEAKLDPSEGLAGQVNQTHLNTTDPDSQLAHGRHTSSRPSYKHHRVVDDACGVITAQTTTGGAVKEDTQFAPLVQQHQAHCASTVQTAVADSQYGTVENYLYCQDHDIRAHMADLKAAQERAGLRGEFFGEDRFTYDPATDTYLCPAGQRMRRWQHRPEKRAWQYRAGPPVCAACPLRSQCTEAKGGRRVQRHYEQTKVAAARAQAASAKAIADRKRRRHLMEGSFADAANNHGFKQARWRGLWRQRIQNGLIAACQNVRILLKRGSRNAGAAPAAAAQNIQKIFRSLCHRHTLLIESFRRYFEPFADSLAWNARN